MATALVLGACATGSEPGPTRASPPVPLFEGRLRSATVQGPDGTARTLRGPALQEIVAPALPLAAFRTIADSGDRYGLDRPAYVVELTGEGGRRSVVELGSSTFDDEGFYARRCGDDRIHLVTRTLRFAVERIAAEGVRVTPPPRLGC